MTNPSPNTDVIYGIPVQNGSGMIIGEARLSDAGRTLVAALNRDVGNSLFKLIRDGIAYKVEITLIPVPSTPAIDEDSEVATDAKE